MVRVFGIPDKGGKLLVGADSIRPLSLPSLRDDYFLSRIGGYFLCWKEEQKKEKKRDHLSLDPPWRFSSTLYCAIKKK